MESVEKAWNRQNKKRIKRKVTKWGQMNRFVVGKVSAFRVMRIIIFSFSTHLKNIS